MEFPFDVRLAVGVRMQGIVCIDREGLLKLQHQRAAALYGFGSSYAPQQHTDDRQDHVRSVVDRLGEASARAQGLKVPITSYVKMLSTDTRMYCKVEANRALGFIKVGRKKLFIRDPLGNMREMEPLCVLGEWSGADGWVFGRGHVSALIASMPMPVVGSVRVV